MLRTLESCKLACYFRRLIFANIFLVDTWYGISDNGWMTTDVFSSWFDKFVKQITERPLLLIYDGHLTHVSIPVIELAMKENIIIFKFPPHVTDVLQPLDVTCFGPLKRMWEKCLNQWGPKEPVKKAQFVNLLDEIWHDGLSKPNIQAGFSKTGIFPINRERFPVKRFDPRILARYER